MPGHSPGARIHEGVGTSSLASLCVVLRFGAAYIIRVTTAVCSANSAIVDVCSTTSCAIATSVPSRSAPRRSRWIVGVRYPVTANICWRVTATFAGRPTTCAAIAARITFGRGVPFEPKPPPTCGEITRTCRCSSPKAFAAVCRTGMTP